MSSDSEEDNKKTVEDDDSDSAPKTMDPDDSDDKTKENCEAAWKVFLAHKSIKKDDWSQFSATMLPHPKSQADTMFLLDSKLDEDLTESNDGKCVYEILTMTEEEGLSSWFIGDYVSSNGNLYIFTPLDPLFLILPALSKNKQAKPFADHLIEHFPLKPAKILTRRILPEQLLHVAIKKTSGDIEAYLYDEPKTISWLSKKVKKIAKYFEVRNITRSEASVSSNFTKAAVSAAKSEEEYLLYACDIISEYIEDSLKLKLRTTLGLPAESERQKRRKFVDEGDGSKRLKMDDGEPVQPLEDYGSSSKGTKSTPKGPSTTKQKQLQQAAKGTHSLFKFFTAKPKTG